MGWVIKLVGRVIFVISGLGFFLFLSRDYVWARGYLVVMGWEGS